MLRWHFCFQIPLATFNPATPPHTIVEPTGRQFKLQTVNQTISTEIWALNAGSHTKRDEATFIHDNLSYYSNLRPQETKTSALTGTSYSTKKTQSVF